MTLATGCRVVCRKNRTEPRITKIADVVRMAKAAVKNGDAPCAITRAVGSAIGCTRSCEDDAEKVANLLADTDAAIDEVLDALLEFARIMSGGALDVYEEAMDAAIGDEDISARDRIARAFRRITRRVGFLFSIADVYQALVRVYSAIDVLYITYRSLASAATALIECATKGDD